MGLFDNLLGRNPRRTEQSTVQNTQDSFFNGTTEVKQEKSSPVEVFIPTSFNDVEKIINALRNRNNAIVKLGNLKTGTMIRVIDMLSGAVYALGGGLYEIEKNTYMLSPDGVTVKK